MDDETIPLRNDFHEDFYDLSSSRKVKNPGTQCQAAAARHTASHVDFRVNPDIGRIRDGDYSRRKHRAKCCHREFSYRQDSQENYSIDANRKSDHFSRKNSDKSGATLNQRLEYEKNASFPTNIRRPTSSSKKRTQTHRPGTSTIHCQNRSNQLTSGLHRHLLKSENFCHRDPLERDSSFQENVHSDFEKEETDYCLSHEPIHSRNMCKHTEPCWRSGEPHSEPETDLPPKNHRKEWSDLEKRKSGQGECIEVSNSFEGDGKMLVETGSSVVKEDWQQYERDQRELKDLNEGLRQFVKLKMSSGQVAEEKEQRDDESSDILEKINRFVSKIPAPGPKNSKAKISPEPRKNRVSSPKTRIRTSRIDARKTYHSRKIEERLGEEHKEREVGRKLEDELLDIQLESSKLEDEEDGETYEEEDEDLEEDKEDEEEEEEEEEKRNKEDEAASETEEEARQLKEEADIEHLRRRLEKSWTGMLREGSKKDSRDARKMKKTGNENVREKNKGEKNGGDPRKEKRQEKSKISYKGMEIPVNVEKQNYSDATATRGDDFKNDTEPRDKVNSRRNKNCKDAEREATRENSYKKQNSLLNVPKKYCNGPPPDRGGKHDIELNTNKTKTSIDEMIDDGLCREAKRVNAALLPLMKKDSFDEEDETSQIYSKDSRKRNSPIKTKCSEDCCHSMTRRREIFPIASKINHDSSRIKKEDCFCRRIGKTPADHNPAAEFVRKLKNRKWYYLESIRNGLTQLYDLEALLDAYSPRREEFVLKTEMNSDLTS